MRQILGTTLAFIIVLILGGGTIIYSGTFNVAATERHSWLVYHMFELARVRSIRAHAAGIAAPADLGSEVRVVNGTSHFAEHCASCHSAPGVEASDMAQGMYPSPPVLTDVSQRYTPAELFWILKNGIKMSGMPSWADHGDDDLWNTVAFMERLPGMSEQEYGKLVMAAMAAGGHHMHGGGERDEAPASMDMPKMDMPKMDMPKMDMPKMDMPGKDMGGAPQGQGGPAHPTRQRQ